MILARIDISNIVLHWYIYDSTYKMYTMANAIHPPYSCWLMMIAAHKHASNFLVAAADFGGKQATKEKKAFSFTRTQKTSSTNLSQELLTCVASFIHET